MLSPSRCEEFPRVADAKGPRPEDRAIARAVKNMVESEHISKRVLDDELSIRAYDRFLNDLDSLKLYFLQSDIDDFAKYRTKLDDMAKNGDISFAYTVYQRQLERIRELMPYVHQMIDAAQDFSLDESIVTDKKTLTYAKTKEELLERWRKQIKYSILVLKSEKIEDKDTVSSNPVDGDGTKIAISKEPVTYKSIDEVRAQLHRRYKTLERSREQMDVYELLELYLSSLTESLDPHTNYMAPRSRANFDIALGLKLEGIGAQLKFEDGTTVISGVVPGGAAARDGRLKEGDSIVAVGQEGKPEMIDVLDMKLDDVVSLIRGPAGTKVRLSVKPKVGDPKIIEIVRAKIELADAAARGEVLQRGVKADGTPYRVGYIDLPSFYLDMEQARRKSSNYRSTTTDMAAILKDFNDQKVDVVVLDLSRNGGGSLPEAVSCTGLFIDRGPVVQVKDSDGQVMPLEDEDAGVAWDGPLVVMTSKLSASASEIFAGAIKDYNRGLVVGDPTTHGKGTVQTLLDVGQVYFQNAARPYGALKLTIQQFYLPDGQSTQRAGVTADVILPSITANMDIAESDLDYALPADRIPSQRYMNYRMVDNAIRAEVTAKSMARVGESKDFGKLLRGIESYKKQKAEKTRTLNEAKYLAQEAEFDAEKVETEELTKDEKNKDRIFKTNFYSEEVANIAVDYFSALSDRQLIALQPGK
ncbi:MAG: carboxy terminal-processing peptidase [Planctomycetota bacterium]|nr:carboxy terminal-processing peptidase [Planctomycetota bacterium]